MGLHFRYPKPKELISYILQIGSSPGDLVMDSFAGGGTTGHAVLELNKQGLARKFILIELDERIAIETTSERLRLVSKGYTDTNGLPVDGSGGGFQYCKLSDEPLFTPDGQIRLDVSFAQLAEFVWFAETGTGYGGPSNSALLGMYEGRAIYLLYNGILKDKSVSGGNVLTGRVYESLPDFDGPKVVYAAACRLGSARLLREGITFKQTPYALEG